MEERDAGESRTTWARHFLLETRIPIQGGTSGARTKREMILYLGVLAGALAHEVFLCARDGVALNWGALVSAAIASIVVFPTIYREGGLSHGEMRFTKWCIAFQNGFFWGVLLPEIARGVPHR